VLGKDEHKWTCYVGKYAPAGDAKNIAEIKKYWTFKDPADPDKCTVAVGQVAQKDVSINDIYESKDAPNTNTAFLAHPTDTLAADHVYEAQTLANFIKWLADETDYIGTTYKKPTANWVLQQLLGEGPFRIKSAGKTDAGSLNTPKAGEIPVVLMAYGFGRSDGVKGISGGQEVERIPKARGNRNLVLLDKKINGPKGIWFRKNKPDSKWNAHLSQEEARLEVRRVSSKTPRAPAFSSLWGAFAN
jgi:hypothetical protein